jgi:hypothetical protein
MNYPQAEPLRYQRKGRFAARMEKKDIELPYFLILNTNLFATLDVEPRIILMIKHRRIALVLHPNMVYLQNIFAKGVQRSSLKT